MRVVGDGYPLGLGQRIPNGPLRVRCFLQKGDGSMAYPRWGKGSTTLPKKGWAMAPRLPHVGEGLWLHCFP